MNMRILKPSRKRLKAGDIFVYQMKRKPYGFGRVIRTDCRFCGSGDTVLLYIYNAFSPAKNQVPQLRKDRLLLPPILTNRLAWSRGYFETIANRPLERADVLKVHCFYSDLESTRRYFNEDSVRLRERSEPCGLHALDSFKTIDVGISMALHLDPAPDTVPPPSPPLDKIVAGVAREFDADASQWRRGGRGDIFARSVAAWLARYRFDYPVEAIAEALGYSGAGSARQAIRRIDRKREQLSSMLRKLGHKLSKSVTPQHRRKRRR